MTGHDWSILIDFDYIKPLHVTIVPATLLPHVILWQKHTMRAGPLMHTPFDNEHIASETRLRDNAHIILQSLNVA